MHEQDKVEKTKRLRQPSKTTDILFRKESPGFIKPSDHVLVIGPGMQVIPNKPYLIPMDRSLFVLPTYLARGKGQLTVLDTPDTDSYEYGDHSLSAMKKFIDYLSTKSPVCKNNYLQGILLEHEYIFPAKYDCIVDHLTAYDWLLMNTEPIDAQIMAPRIITLYSSLLNPGGKMILHYDRDYLFRTESLYNSIKSSDLEVHVFDPIQDIYAITTSLRADLAKEMGGFARGFDRYKRLKSYYPSSGVLVGKKSK